MAGACLDRVILFCALLFRVDLPGTDIRGADLTEAVLCAADLGRADLSGTVLCDADLEAASLPQTLLKQADLQRGEREGKG